MSLSVPPITADDDALSAALKYAKCGWYVLPVKKGAKHPGSVVGFSWNDKSSRDPETIISWFAGSDYGIALHCGRSGAVVLDVDRPDNLPDWLNEMLGNIHPPFQNTRSTDGRIGHYIFTQPTGRTLGNGTGQLGGEWGDVRGANGVIIVAPSEHEKASEGGHYRWLATGVVPYLPDGIADKLTDATPAEDAASDAVIAAFLHVYDKGDNLHLIQAWSNTFVQAVSRGESRHGKALSMLTGALKEAKAGLFPAGIAVHRLKGDFLTAVGHDGTGQQGKGRTGAVAGSEWAGILAWAVSQANAADDTTTLQRLAEHAPGMTPDWVQPLSGAQNPPVTAAQPLAAPATTRAAVEQVHPVVAAPALGGVFGDLALAQVPADADAYGAAEQVAEYHDHDVNHAMQSMPPGVAMELQALRNRTTAKELLEQEQWSSTFREPPSTLDLAGELALPDEDITFRVDQILPTGGNAILIAQYKAGKTTLTLNLARALADDAPFLGKLGVAPLTGRVGIFNYEVGRGQFRRWMREADIQHPQRVAVLNLRGFALPVTTPRAQDFIVRWLEEREVTVWFVDPFARAFTGVSENDNTEVGRWLDTLDVIKERAGVAELVLPVHTGRGEMEQGMERARGATRLDDWADVRWTLTRDKDKHRYFAATGRDVEFDECILNYNSETRTLSLGTGDRAQVKRADIKTEAFLAVQQLGGADSIYGVKQGDIVARLGKRDQDVRTALAELVEDGKLVVRADGPSKKYTIPKHPVIFGGNL